MKQCAQCRHFSSGATLLEQAIPGLRVMGSGYSSVVSSDGLCVRLDRYLSANYSCDQFQYSLTAAELGNKMENVLPAPSTDSIDSCAL